MRNILSGTIKAVALGAALLAGTSPAAVAANANGIPLRAGQNCGIQVYLSNSGGIVMPKASGHMGGSYRFRMYQAIPTSDLDIALNGRFQRSGSGSTTLARNSFSLGYVVRGGYRGMDELRDAALGEDAALVGSLQVYDNRGRMTCSTNSLQILPIQALTGHPASHRQTYRPSGVRQPENARLAHERMAATPRQTQPHRALTPEECRRLSMGRHRPCD